MERVNNQSSPVLQAFIDACASCTDQETQELLDSLVERVKDKEWLSEADKLFNNHQYPDRNITYTKFMNYNKNPMVNEVVKERQETAPILLLIAQTLMSDGAVELSLSYITKYTGLSRPKAKKGLDALLEAGILVCVEPPGKNEPGVYLVDPDIMSVGKPVTEGQRARFDELLSRKQIVRGFAPYIAQAETKITVTNRKCNGYDLKVTKLQPVIQIKKPKDDDTPMG